MPRMTNWLIVSLVLAVVILLLAPQQLPVTAYKLSLITVAGWIGYWMDRGLFPYARPDALLPDIDPDMPEHPCADEGVLLSVGCTAGYAFEASMLRRAIIVSACIIGVALGA